MKFGECLFRCFLAIAFGMTATFAATVTGKVRSVIGDVKSMGEKKKEWKPVKQGAKVYYGDLYRTGVESEAILGLPDGSMITIAELSEIGMSELFEADGSFKTAIDVNTGRLAFSTQKQGKNSEFKFKTGVATATIRGTEGSLDGGNVFLAGLVNGALDISTFDGQSAYIRGGQIAFVKDGELVVMNVKSAGDLTFHKRLAYLLSDSTYTLDELKQKISHDDSTFQAKVSLAQEKVKCVMESMPDTVRSNVIVIKGKCPAEANVKLYGEPIVFERDGIFVAKIEIDPTAIGEKHFKLSCSETRFDFQCGEVYTYYKPEAEKIRSNFNVQSSIPVEVCDEGLRIDGTYQTQDSSASLYLVVGSSYRSQNLVLVPDGKVHPFKQSLPVTDQNGLWTLKSVTMEFEADGRKDYKQIPISVNKSCQGVNLKAAKVNIASYDSLYCNAIVNINNLADDVGIFTPSVDNVEGASKIFTANTSVTVPLKKGVHEYDFTVVDKAQNTATASATLGCYPDKAFKIEFVGGNQQEESVWFPPGPPKRNVPIQRELRFKVKLDDVRDVYSVIVKQNGSVILHEVLEQVQSLDYSLTVELIRGKKNVFDVFVKYKGGRTEHATRVYEVN